MTNKLFLAVVATVLMFTGTAASRTNGDDKRKPERVSSPVTENLEALVIHETRVSQSDPQSSTSAVAPDNRATSAGPDDRQKSIARDKRSTQTDPDDYVFPTAEKRFKRFLEKTAGPAALLGAGIGSTFQQIGEKPPEWEQNAKGFARRFASNLGENAIEQTSVYAISELMGQDPTYVKSRSTKFSKRAIYAIKSGFTARNRNGRTVFSPAKVVSPFIGSVTAVKTWYPKRYSVQDGIREGGYSLAFNVGFNLIREFIFKK